MANYFSKYLDPHPLRGALFENMVVTEFLKKRAHQGLPSNLFYWCDKTGHEVDLIIDNGRHLFPVEIKFNKITHHEYFKNMDYWNKLSRKKQSLLNDAGEQTEKRKEGKEVTNWRKIRDLKI